MLIAGVDDSIGVLGRYNTIRGVKCSDSDGGAPETECECVVRCVGTTVGNTLSGFLGDSVTQAAMIEDAGWHYGNVVAGASGWHPDMTVMKSQVNGARSSDNIPVGRITNG